MRKVYVMLKYGILKGIRYRANLFSWIIADISLYSSVALVYLMLFTKTENMGGYSFLQMALYISTYFMINNLYAVFFSEATSEYASSILGGNYLYLRLLPISVEKVMLMSNFNFPALVSSPLLVIMNIIILKCNYVSAEKMLFYYILIFIGIIVMAILFQMINTLLLFGIRSSSLGSVVSQLLTIAEKPDLIFSKNFRKFFTYFLPVFMFSAVPTKFALGMDVGNQVLYMLICPFIFYILNKLLVKVGERFYKSEVE